MLFMTLCYTMLLWHAIASRTWKGEGQALAVSAVGAGSTSPPFPSEPPPPPQNSNEHAKPAAGRIARMTIPENEQSRSEIMSRNRRVSKVTSNY